MKKTILLLSALLIFTACGTQELQKEKEDELTTSVLNVDEEVEDVEVVEVEEVESTEPLKEAEKTEAKPIVKKNITVVKTEDSIKYEASDVACAKILNIAPKDVTDTEMDECYFKDSSRDLETICPKISKNSWKYTVCNRYISHQKADVSYCNVLPESQQELDDLYAKEKYDWHPDIGMTRKRCKQDISYQYQDANWQLEPDNSLESYKYNGHAELKGWIEYRTVYDPEKTYPFFNVADESKLKLPPHYQEKRNFFTVADDIVNQLKPYNAQNPANVTATEIRNGLGGEGPIKLTITKVQ